MPRSAGTILAMRSLSAKERSSTRDTSRTTAFAFIVPKVMICATFSRPYFWVTYSITSPRRFSQKSMSISGGLMRSSFRNRSKMRPFSIGIDVGDLERIGDQAARRRTTAGPDGNPAILREADEVANDQKVGGETDAMNDADLASEASLVVGNGHLEPPRRGQRLEHLEPLGKAVARHLLEEGLGGVARRHVEPRNLWVVSSLNSTMSAIFTVFESASGTWPKSASISSALFT